MVPINILGAQPFKRFFAAQNNANLIEPKYNYMETYYDRALRMQKINHKWILEQQNQQK